MSHTVAPPADEITEPRLYVGQHVWICGMNRREPGEGEITKVGRKLVTIREGKRVSAQFRIDGGVKNDQFGHDWFYTDEEFERVERHRRALAALGQLRLIPQPGCALTLEQLEAIVALMGAASSDTESGAE